MRGIFFSVFTGRLLKDQGKNKPAFQKWAKLKQSNLTNEDNVEAQIEARKTVNEKRPLSKSASKRLP